MGQAQTRLADEDPEEASRRRESFLPQAPPKKPKVPLPYVSDPMMLPSDSSTIDSSASLDNLDNYELLQVVGSGAFSKVRVVRQMTTNNVYALKYSVREDIVKLGRTQLMLNERRILLRLQHPFLCNLHQTFCDSEYLYTLLDLMTGGDLRWHIERKTFSEATIRFWVVEVACAVAYLHEKGVVHRDIKPDNIMLDELGHARLGDFNVACMLPYGEYKTDSGCGTIGYMAPEVVRAKYNHLVDWWSLGAVFYECLYGTVPYRYHSTDEYRRMKLKEHSNLFPVTQPQVSMAAIEALDLLLTVEAQYRLHDVDQLLQLSYFRGFTRLGLEKKLYSQHMDKGVMKEGIGGTNWQGPVFVPDADELNYDESLDVEELLMLDRSLVNDRAQGFKRKKWTSSNRGQVILDEEYVPFERKASLNTSISACDLVTRNWGNRNLSGKSKVAGKRRSGPESGVVAIGKAGKGSRVQPIKQ